MTATHNLVRYRTASGVRAALVVREGRKYAHVILMDSPIKLTRVPLSETRWMSPLTYSGRRRTANNAFLAAGRELGITDTARRVLRGRS